jgi:hypothetical protein
MNRLTLIFAIFLTASFTGLSACKTGNFTEEKVSYTGPAVVDTVSGFYRTEPQSLRLCASFSDANRDTKCVDVAPKEEWLPLDFVLVLANPIAFILENPTSSSAAIVDPATYKETQVGMGVQFDKNTNAVNTNYQTRYKFLSYSKCVMTDSGFTDPANDGVSQIRITDDGLPVNGFTTRGSLDLKINFTRVFETTDNSDQCSLGLTDAQNCFHDQSTCGGATDQENEDLRRLMIALFGPHVDAGALNSNEIQFLKSLTSKVLYR